MGALELNFLLDGNDTDGTLMQFEMIVPPAAKVPAPHFHVEADETLTHIKANKVVHKGKIFKFTI
jgi:hypothetical protein